jgi:hypothetical protein
MAAHWRRWLSSQQSSQINKDQLVTEPAGNETLLACQHDLHADPPSDSSRNGWTRASTARAKGAIGRLDFHFTLVLSARGEPECAARGLNNRGAGPFVWIIHKLVEADL